MENLFNNLQAPTKEIKVTSENNYFSVRMGGVLKIKKGNFSQRISYWAEISKMNYSNNNYISVDDVDWEELDTMLGDLKIDSLSKLKTTLTDSGLKTLSDSLNFDSEEVRKAISSIMAESNEIKSIFGEDSIIWQSLTQKEKDIATLKDRIENYNDYSINHTYRLKGIIKINITNEDGSINEQAIPTLEQLNDRLNFLLTSE